MEQRVAHNATVVDLFCGCGGLSLGFALEGFNIVLGVDNDNRALKTFERNFPSARAVPADLHFLVPSELMKLMNGDPGQLDVLIGGPPCQSFSKNVPAAMRFFEDPRNQLLSVFVSFADALRPKFVVMENVGELVNAYEGALAGHILSSLRAIGYEADLYVLLAADYGVPQMRRRAFFVANRLGLRGMFPEPTHVRNNRQPTLFDSGLKPYVTVRGAISDLPPLRHGEGHNPDEYTNGPASEYQRLMRVRASKLYDHVARRLAPTQLERIKSLKEGEGANQLPEHLRPNQGYSGAYARLWWDKPAATITRWVFHPGSGRFSHPCDDRVITIREAARIQAFPDDFVFEGTYLQKSRQLGEAVPPLLAGAIAHKIRELMAGLSAPDLKEVNEFW